MKFPLLPLFSFPLCALLITGCDTFSHKEKEHHSTTQSAPTIATLAPAFGTFSSRTTVSASVVPSPQGLAFITSPVNGTVENIHVSVGSKVSSSTPLATLKSGEVSDVYANKLEAQAGMEQSKRVYEMNQELAKMGAISTNDLLASHTAYKQSLAILRGYDEKLSYLGASAGRSLTLRSPFNGVVYDIATHVGEKVSNDPQNPLIKIANPESKMIVATVYEKDLPAFELGDTVTISAPRAKDIEGVVTYINDVVDPLNKTVSVTIKPKSSTSQLKFNMFVKVSVDAMYENVFRVSKKAILFKEGKFVVFVKQGSSFFPCPITVLNDDTATEFSLVQGIPPQSVIAAEAISMDRQ